MSWDSVYRLVKQIPRGRVLTYGAVAKALRLPGAAESIITQCLSRFGRADALFNVAGLSGRRFGDGPLHEIEDEAWRATLLHCDDAALDMVGYSTYPYGSDATEAFIDIVWWVNQEVLHHGAEMALLRDLHRADQLPGR